MSREPAIHFVHLQAVRVGGFDGVKGKMIHCKSQRKGEYYWRIKLENGRWIYPDHQTIVADSDGPHEGICALCGIPFRGKDDRPCCPQCDPTAQLSTRLFEGCTDAK